MFRLNDQLTQDTIQIEDWELCRVRLMNDRRFPWIILIPRRTDLRDMDQVPVHDKDRLYKEIDRAMRALRAAVGPFKMNVASLGNQVAQLHIHVIARFQEDAAWPAPVWGVGEAEPYSDAEADILIRRIRVASKNLQTPL